MDFSIEKCKYHIKNKKEKARKKQQYLLNQFSYSFVAYSRMQLSNM